MAEKYEPKYSSLYKLSALVEKYGKDATIEYIFEKCQGPYKYKCPHCNGSGYIRRAYNGYTDRLPDSGYVFE
jgi:hypothetical protein